ncbi:MAG: ABC-F family ATP-binding cassette domain-containing protein [Actinomycetota bacterium]|jgi:ATPase subunit of ABC transporter with duplicated ATPase domains
MTLQVSQLRIEIGARVLLDDASFQVLAGEKVALVGPNGAGKTTLLRTIAGQAAPAGGSVRLPPRVGWLAQDTTPQPGVEKELVFDHLLAASPLATLRDKLADAHDHMHDAGADTDALDRAVHRYGDLEERFRLGGGYELEPAAERIAAGLGLDTDALLSDVGSLSGGQRRRLELARLLLAGGDLLVLDEPTNHLDAEAKAFVMGFLRTTPSAVLVVSHDIELMNDSIDRVLALEAGQLAVYRGTYSQFLSKRDEREAAAARENVNAQREIARLERTADKFRQGNATAARKRKALEQRIGRIVERQESAMPVVKRRPLKVRFPDPVRAGDLVLTVDGLTKRLGGTTVLRNVGFTVGRSEVFVVVGPNGAGKTTLLRCIYGIYAHDAGSVRLGANVTVGYYAQEHEDIRPGASVFGVISDAAAPGLTEAELRGILGHFGLKGDVADQEAATLSGGEKTKLSLARLVAGKANLLLLDEPTNNLDTASREAVLAALQHFKGTVVLVSHDVDFVTQLGPEHAIVLPSGRGLPFDERMLDLVPQREAPTAVRA